MAHRRLREGLLKSAVFNALSEAEQMLFVRLLLVADDFGCFDGREAVIASQCYRTQAVSIELVAARLHALHQAGLIIRYSNRARPYLAILQWEERYRGLREFPAPPINVDLDSGRKLTGKFNRPIGWINPHGSDHTSILLDINGRAAVPQPEEWRPPSHSAVVTMKRSHGASMTGRTVTTAQSLDAHDQEDRHSHYGTVTGAPELEIELEKEVKDKSVVVEMLLKPELVTTAPSPATGNGSIGFHEGEFTGLSEGQRVRWQTMFDELKIPEELDHMAAWLQANPGECKAIQLNGGGIEAFIVRWLLRESRSHGSYQGAR